MLSQKPCEYRNIPPPYIFLTEKRTAYAFEMGYFFIYFGFVYFKFRGETFFAEGNVPLSRGYKEVTAPDGDESGKVFPALKEGEVIRDFSLKKTEGKTKPPARFTEGTLLKAMENPVKYMQQKDAKAAKTLQETGGLGTVATRADIIEKLNGLDKISAGRTSGEGFYYLLGDIARLHEALLAYARDYMIDKGFTYAIPPFMIHSDVVNGVMSFAEMEAMMYKIEGEDLYLIGTSEHSMIGRFLGQIVDEKSLPIALTSYSPCFRKEGGAHGLEEKGVYRVHQFEKQEMIVLCEPEDSNKYYEDMWKYTVEVFRNMNVPVRQLECCSGDLADLKVKSCDVEAWSPRQQKYFEVGSCSNLGDAQARRLGIRVKSEKGNYYLHTLNNTVVASPRGLIAVIENNYNEDGSITIPEVLRPYMGGKKIIK